MAKAPRAKQRPKPQRRKAHIAPPSDRFPNLFASPGSRASAVALGRLLTQNDVGEPCWPSFATNQKLCCRDSRAMRHDIA